MDNNSISSKVFEQLKEEHIQPKPKWEFMLKNSALWAVLALFLVIGSLASSVIFFMIDTNQWDLYEKINDNFFAFMLVVLPFFWVSALIIFLVAIYYYFQKTNSGYKYHAYAVILASFGLSLVLGVVFYNSGLALSIDKIFEEKVPLYSKLINTRQEFLNKPELGVLPGQIVKIIDQQQFILIDVRNNSWDVILNPEVSECPCFLGNHIIAIGEAEDNRIFHALEVRELRPRRERPQRVWNYFQLRIWQTAP